MQGAAQNLGQSLGTALIGAVLLTGLTTGFHERVLADPTIPSQVQQQVLNGTEDGLPMVSQAQFKADAEQAGLPPEQVSELVGFYGDAQIEALKRSLLIACAFALVGLWFARSLPGEALTAAEDQPATPTPRPHPAV